MMSRAVLQQGFPIPVLPTRAEFFSSFAVSARTSLFSLNKSCVVAVSMLLDEQQDFFLKVPKGGRCRFNRQYYLLA